MDAHIENWIRANGIFVKSSFSEGGDCVEVARTELIGVRDSHDPNGPVLLFTRSKWVAFADGMLTGVFNRIC